jgi:predicted component of type VI protein secretion system
MAIRFCKNAAVHVTQAGNRTEWQHHRRRARYERTTAQVADHARQTRHNAALERGALQCRAGLKLRGGHSFLCT